MIQFSSRESTHRGGKEFSHLRRYSALQLGLPAAPLPRIADLQTERRDGPPHSLTADGQMTDTLFFSFLISSRARLLQTLFHSLLHSFTLSFDFFFLRATKVPELERQSRSPQSPQKERETRMSSSNLLLSD